ncbi:potassium transporter Kup [Microbulbifer sp. SAOS-129_SWC]|uniref:potassium transporter Kup n=1 Tax=Microbulbifer sp. SAOS-129_SWC TaxID=3145235 RepID=UPI003217CAA1
MADSTGNQPGTPALTLAALGVVYGDIGTSPLYAFRQIFHPQQGLPLAAENIFGAVSLIFWALVVVVTIKYIVLILRADNRGEGGIMALTALAQASVKRRRRLALTIAVAGLCGAALFYGDAVLTPAISVLSAIEGLEVGVPGLANLVVPATIAVLLVLFSLQHFGTATVGALFGPITAIWFLALAAAGLHGLLQHPAILGALNPLYALAFLGHSGFTALAVLGAVVLVFTGAEALYSDMGHFGRTPIRLAWLGLVFPALVLNYLGQGALLISDPGAVTNPFYHLYPRWALFPMVLLATAATVIASQACISGAFSLTRQAIQLGYLPRMAVRHTSSQLIGQVYIPGVNRALALLVVAAVLGFGSSANIASAYGVAVTGTMLVTTFLAFFVYRYRWHYGVLPCVLALLLFGCVDLAFFTASLLKIAHGGWFPLVLGAVILLLMVTWWQGKKVLARKLSHQERRLEDFLSELFREPPLRVPGTAIFLNARPQYVPRALLHNLKHNKVVHERMLFITVTAGRQPRVAPQYRYSLTSLGHDSYRLILHYGFMEQPDIATELRRLDALRRLRVDPEQASYFLSREKVIPVLAVPSGMALWREWLFSIMARNASSAVDFYGIPSNRVIELGSQISI